MLGLSLLQWWYGAGWASALDQAESRLKKAYRLFAVPLLLETLFAPWRRIITAPGAGLGAHIRAAVDNAISRIIGFIVRISVLFAALLVLVMTAIWSMIELAVWPLVPIAVLLLPILGIIW